ncbi:ATP-dependent DNA helicase PIF1-like protein, partial [Tanacetum coccineum]
KPSEPARTKSLVIKDSDVEASGDSSGYARKNAADSLSDNNKRKRKVIDVSTDDVSGNTPLDGSTDQAGSRSDTKKRIKGQLWPHDTHTPVLAEDPEVFVSPTNIQIIAVKPPKHVALTLAGVPPAYHNLGPPSYQCSKCDATIWYVERTDKYNAPTVSEVAALIVNDFGDGIPVRDIVVNKNNVSPQCISELHPSYMALQYPLLFPYGEDGFHEKIDHCVNEGTCKTKCGYVTMKEYYAYIIQHRPNQGTILLRGGRLFQQYLVDAFMAVEEQRLKWMRNNQDTLRVDLYHNLCDAMLAHVPGQKSYDRPEIGTRVFKMKLSELLDDLTKKQIFGDYCAVVFMIEFQKQGLPHAHILLWLEERFKCMTPDEINDIISAELPSPAEDPDRHTLISNGAIDLKQLTGADWASVQISQVDEIKNYLNCRFIAPLTLQDSKNLPELLEREGINITMFTDSFELNKRDTDAREFTIVYSSLASEERYYLRMLLNVVRGAKSFKELMTVNKQAYTTFKVACFAYELLNDGKECWPLQLWEENWTALSEDILHKTRILYKYPALQLTNEKIRNYCLLEFQKLLNMHGRSLAEFQDPPCPNPRLLTNLDNRLIREVLDFNVNKSRVEHEQLHSLLNPEQHLVYDKVIESVHSKSSQFYFIYGPRGTGKTFVYKTIIVKLRSSQKIVLTVASSSTMRANEYSDNGEIDLRKQNFNRWVLAVGAGKLPAKKKETEDEPTWIEILEEFLIKSWSNPIEQIVLETYPDFTTRQTDESYLKERAILTPRNDDADAINKFMFKKLGGVSMTYNSADEIFKASTDTEDQHHLYPVEFLNTLNFLGMQP